MDFYHSTGFTFAWIIRNDGIYHVAFPRSHQRKPSEFAECRQYDLLLRKEKTRETKGLFADSAQAYPGMNMSRNPVVPQIIGRFPIRIVCE